MNHPEVYPDDLQIKHTLSQLFDRFNIPNDAIQPKHFLFTWVIFPSICTPSLWQRRFAGLGKPTATCIVVLITSRF